jgi:hypothetical protein
VVGALVVGGAAEVVDAPALGVEVTIASGVGTKPARRSRSRAAVLPIGAGAVAV